MKIKVNVTKEDIRTGTPKSAHACPIAKATSRAVGRMGYKAQVGMGLNLLCKDTEKLKHRAVCPGMLVNWWKAFDNSENVSPFEFELDGNSFEPPLKGGEDEKS